MSKFVIMTGRRKFIKQSALGSAGITMGGLGFSANSYGSILGSNDRIHVASIGLGRKRSDGLGGMGAQYVKKICEMKDNYNLQVDTICDVDERCFTESNKTVYTSMGIKPKNEWDMRRVLDDKKIDVAFFATPNHWHALGHIWACQAGKHVWTEKPLGYDMSEGRKMVEATDKYNSIAQVGQFSRANHNVHSAIKLLHNGGIGEVYMAKVLNYRRRPSFGIAKDGIPPESLHYDMWLGPATSQAYNEKKVHYNWHWHWNTGNGDIANHGVHQLDIARWGLNKNEHPVSVFSTGGIYGWKPSECSQETPDTQTAVFRYADGKIIECEIRGHYTNGVASQNILLGIIFYGTEGYLELDISSTWRAFKRDEKEPFDKSKVKNSYRQDLLVANFFDAIRSMDKNKLYCSVREGHYSAALCHLANISYRLGRSLKFMGDYEKFANDPEADIMLTRDYRKPYVVPENV